MYTYMQDEASGLWFVYDPFGRCVNSCKSEEDARSFCDYCNGPQ